MTTTITGLPNATTPLSGSERVPMDQAGATKNATTQDIANLAPGTDLSYTASTRRLASSTGADATLPVASGTDPGLMAAADKTKLDGIASGATANSSDASLLSRANHTGTQAAGTITGLAQVATSGAYADLSGRPTLGTAAALDVAASGDATSGQVVKGNDSRLSDSRTPTSHTHPASAINDSTSAGRALLTGADASAQRTSLGLGTLATANAATPPAIGGTTPAAGSFSDLTATTSLLLPGAAPGTPAAGHLYRNADTLRYRDSGGTERLLLNAADNLANLSSASTARTNLGLGTAATSAATAFAASGAITGSGLTMATARLLGRSTANTGAVEEISLPTGFDLSGGAMRAPAELGIACSDETTALTTGAAKVTFRMPYAMTLTAVRLSVSTAPTGSALVVNVKEAGTTIFSTKPQIDAGSTTSVGSGTAAVISDTSLADNALMTIDIDQIGSSVAGAGLKVWLIGRRT